MRPHRQRLPLAYQRLNIKLRRVQCIAYRLVFRNAIHVNSLKCGAKGMKSVAVFFHHHANGENEPSGRYIGAALFFHDRWREMLSLKKMLAETRACISTN